MKKKSEKFLGMFIRTDALRNKSHSKKDELDLTKPSVLIGVTLCYIFIVFFLIIGVPWQGSSPTPIPPEDLPVAIPIFILLYIVVIGGFYLRDKRKK